MYYRYRIRLFRLIPETSITLSGGLWRMLTGSGEFHGQRRLSGSVLTTSYAILTPSFHWISCQVSQWYDVGDVLTGKSCINYRMRMRRTCHGTVFSWQLASAASSSSNLNILNSSSGAYPDRWATIALRFGVSVRKGRWDLLSGEDLDIVGLKASRRALLR